MREGKEDPRQPGSACQIVLLNSYLTRLNLNFYDETDDTIFGMISEIKAFLKCSQFL